MPFTVSHIAAVLWLRRSNKVWLNFSGLVLGSMLPDFNYFLPLPYVSDSLTHSFVGGILYAIPMGMVMVGLVYWLLPSALELAPDPYRTLIQNQIHLAESAAESGARPMPAALRPWLDPVGLWRDFPSFAGFLIALMLGSWTHTLWDAATHRTGFIAANSDLLNTLVFERGDYDFRAFHLLQHLSSILGLLGVLIVLAQWLRPLVKPSHENRTVLGFPIPLIQWNSRARVWSIMIGLSLVYVVAFLVWGFQTAESMETLRHYLVWSVAIFIRGMLIQFLIYCAYKRLKL